jgi:hypothetical protein
MFTSLDLPINLKKPEIRDAEGDISLNLLLADFSRPERLDQKMKCEKCKKVR